MCALENIKIAISPKLFWSFGLTITSNKSPKSPSKSKILGSYLLIKVDVKPFFQIHM